MKPMPYEERIKKGQERKRKMPDYRVTNAPAYNLSVKKRGMISLYFPSEDLKSQFINDTPYVKGVSGCEPSYKEGYIELIYTYYRLYGWGLRQITGFMEDYWATRGLAIPVPSVGQLSDRFAQLNITVKPRCRRLAKRLANGEAVDPPHRQQRPAFLAGRVNGTKSSTARKRNAVAQDASVDRS